MLLRDFDFELPDALIAQEPSSERGDSRLLRLSRATGAVGHSTVSALPELLRPGDLLVVNNTRVFPARLLGHRVPSGGAVECLLVGRVDGGRSQADGERWEALMSPGQKLKPGAHVRFDGRSPLYGEVLERRSAGRRTVRLWAEDGGPVLDAVERIGHMPIPPYIRRRDSVSDRERYQTVFARSGGSIAAPTAGLHFTDALFRALAQAGVERAEITLHIGYGTFQPVRVERVEDHRLESECYDIGTGASEAINRALADRRRVVAVGTTTTRTLEAVARAHNGRIVAGAGASDLFIIPGFEFTVISGLITNFHLPQSSLLMLVSALAGREPVLAAYREAVSSGYRFYSYGDAMLVV